MKKLFNLIKVSVLIFLGMLIGKGVNAQCVTPVITSISNTGPACVGSSVTLNATGTVGGVSSSFIRMAGIGANQGNRAFNQVFSSGDRSGSIDRISMAQFDAIFTSQPTDAAKAAALKAKYDVLMFTWASPIDNNINWVLITEYLKTGGSVFVDGDYANITKFNDGTPNSVIGVGSGTTYGCNYTLVNPAPFPSLVANGVNGCFANDHLYVQSFPSWMKTYITAAGRNLAVAGIYPYGNQGRLIVQGPDQDYHAYRGAGGTGGNQYQIILNQMDFLTANQAGFTWTGPNGFTSNEANPIISNLTAANAGVYTATLTNSNGGCFTTASTTVIVNTPAEIPTITASGATNLCPGSVVTLTSSSGSSYLWSNGATSQSINVTTAGNYSVKVPSSNGCIGTSLATTVNVNNSFCNRPPVALGKSITISADNGCSGNAIASDFNNGSSDPDGDAITFSISPVGPYSKGTTPILFTVTDSKGASSSTSVSVTVVDTTNPVITSTQSDAIVALNAINGTATLADYTSSVTSTDNCTTPSSVVIIQNPSVGTPLVQNVPTTVTLTATDESSNYSTQTFTVTATDQTVPVTVTKNITVQLDAEGSVNITPSQVDNGSTDNVGIATLGLSKSSFNCSNVGANTVTLTVTDASNNSSNATAIVTVQDNVAPIVLTLNKTIQLSASGNASITAADINNGSSDNCGIASVVLSKTSFDCSNFGANTVTLTVTDIHGNVSTATAIVTVQDNVAPIVVAQNKTIQLNASGNATITAADINNGSSDNCGITSVVLSKTSFDCSNFGANTVTLTVTDIHGNISTADAIVTVQDNVAPIVVAQNKTIQLNASGNASITAADINNGSSDNCGIASVVLSKTSFDCSNYGANTVNLTVTDIHGNVATATAIVTVQDNVAPIVITQNLVIPLSGGSATISAAQINNGSTDNCGIASMTINRTGFDCSSIGNHTITLTVTDIHGNVSTKTATVTIVGELTSTNIASVPTNSTFTGGVSTNLYLGYGAQSTTLQTSNIIVGGNGTSPKSYTYVWSGSATSQLSSITSGSPVFTPTTAGYYTFNVLVTNKYGCTSAATISICVKDIREVTTDKKGITSYTGKVFICHAPPGNVGNSNTLSISVNAVAAHLSQHSFDRLGSCADAPCSASQNAMSTNSTSGAITAPVKIESTEISLHNTEFVAYPNPFGKQTTVRFTLPYQEDKAILDIYDLKGVRIQNLFNGNANAQTTYEVQFNGQNIASGTYIFRLITSKEVKNFKVIMTQ
jgi:PKD repeat protein